jgi:hypothetical protein
MSNQQNRHGLDRNIPAVVKREIRQLCSNGCVICGKLPYHYDHFDPPFRDAERHTVEGIALLCPNHHLDREAGRLSYETVARARENPFNRGRPAVWSHYLTETELRLAIGGNLLKGSTVSCVVNGSTIISLKAPGIVGGQWLISGNLCDTQGRNTLQFKDNEVIVSTGVWDFSMEGSILSVRDDENGIVARLSFKSDDREIRLDYLKMLVQGENIMTITPEKLRIDGPRLKDCSFSGNVVWGEDHICSLSIDVPLISGGRLIFGIGGSRPGSDPFRLDPRS